MRLTVRVVRTFLEFEAFAAGAADELARQFTPEISKKTLDPGPTCRALQGLYKWVISTVLTSY